MHTAPPQFVPQTRGPNGREITAEGGRQLRYNEVLTEEKGPNTWLADLHILADPERFEWQPVSPAHGVLDQQHLLLDVIADDVSKL